MPQGPTHIDQPSPATSVLEKLLDRWSRKTLAVYWPTLALLTHWPYLKIANPDIVGPIQLDKLLHVGAFSCLALLLIFARLPSRAVSMRHHVIIGTFVAVVYSIFDELTQSFVGREVSASDILANLLGIGLVMAVVWRWRVACDEGMPGGNEGNENGTTEVSAQPVDAKSKPAKTTHNQSPLAFVDHAKLVSGLTLASRVLGLARDAVLAACFGMTAITDAFWLAFVVPNLFRRLFGEGAMTAAFIPAYTGLLRDDPAKARRLAWVSVSVLLVVLGAVTVIGEFVLTALLGSSDWSADTHLAIRLTMIMLPYMPMICGVALLGGVLQVHKRFGPPAAAPVLLNIAMIGAALLGAGLNSSGADVHNGITIVATAVLVAGLFQLAWQAVAAHRETPFTLRLSGVGTPFRKMLWTMVPMVLGLAVFQFNTLLDSLIAWVLSPKAGGNVMLSIFGWELAYPVRQGAVTGLQFAQRLYQFPLGVFGIALATAIFPALAHAAAVHHADGPASKGASNGTIGSGLDEFRTILQQGLQLTIFVGLPASVGLILVRVPLVRVIFERYEFTIEDSARVAMILAGYGAAVWAYAMTHVLTRAYYALGDSRTPLIVCTAMTAVNLVLNLTLVWWLGVAALAWSTAISSSIQAVLLLRLISRYVTTPIGTTVRQSWVRSSILTAAMTIALTPIVWAYNPLTVSRTGAAAQLLVMVVLGMGIVFVGARLMKMHELRWLTSRHAR